MICCMSLVRITALALQLGAYIKLSEGGKGRAYGLVECQDDRTNGESDTTTKGLSKWVH